MADTVYCSHHNSEAREGFLLKGFFWQCGIHPLYICNCCNGHQGSQIPQISQRTTIRLGKTLSMCYSSVSCSKLANVSHLSFEFIDEPMLIEMCRSCSAQPPTSIFLAFVLPSHHWDLSILGNTVGIWMGKTSCCNILSLCS